MLLLKENDIIEFSMFSNNKVIKFGASCECSPGDSKFFDKRYSIDDRENVSIEELKEYLYTCSPDGKICIMEIDGVLPKYYRKS